MISIIQGNSFTRSYTADAYPDLSGGGWVGVWAIVPALGSAAVASGSLTNTGTVMELKLTPIIMETVPVAKYMLVAQIKNDSLGYKDEVQEKMEVTPQGIPG